MSGHALDRGEPRLRWHRQFPGSPAEVRAARRWIAALLLPCDAADDVALIASELATNALLHTASGASGGHFGIDVAWWPEAVQVSVRDDGGAATSPRVVHDSPGEQQRGLKLVDAIATGWSFTDDAAGRVVQAECPWGGRGGAVPDRLPGGRQLARAAAALAAWFPDTPVWCGLAGWLALLPPPGGLVAADSPAGLGQVIARALAEPGLRPAMASRS